jgi:RNA polymerase sigma-70 factor, ECF subfamily
LVVGQRVDVEELYAAFAGAVFTFARRRVPADEAEDVVAEVFLVAWRRREEIPAVPLPWLLGVARRVLANRRRSHERMDALVDRLAQEALLARGRPDELDLGALRALASLSRPDQEILLLVMGEDPLDRLRRANPFPRTLAAPPVERLRARLDGVPAPVPRHGPTPGSGAPGKRSRVRAGLAAAPLAIAVATSIAVAAVALLVLRHGKTPSWPPSSAPLHAVSGLPPVPSLSPGNKHLLTYFTKAERSVRGHDQGCAARPVAPIRLTGGADGAPSQALLATFGVLRRQQPQHPSPVGPGAGISARYVRVAQRRYGHTFEVAPDTSGFPLLTLQDPPRCQRLEFAALNRLLAHAPVGQRRRAVQLAHNQLLDEQYIEHHTESVCVFGAGGGECGPFLYAQARGGLQSTGYGSRGSLSAYLVPDGVATVTAHYPPRGPNTGFRHRLAPATVTAPVVNNVAVWRLKNEPGDIFPTTITWRSSSGKTLKVVYQG